MTALVIEPESTWEASLREMGRGIREPVVSRVSEHSTRDTVGVITDGVESPQAQASLASINTKSSPRTLLQDATSILKKKKS